MEQELTKREASELRRILRQIGYRPGEAGYDYYEKVYRAQLLRARGAKRCKKGELPF